MLGGALEVVLFVGSGLLLLVAALLWRSRQRVASVAARVSPGGGSATDFVAVVGLICGGMAVIACLWVGYALLAM